MNKEQIAGLIEQAKARLNSDSIIACQRAAIGVITDFGNTIIKAIEQESIEKQPQQTPDSAQDTQASEASAQG